MGLYREIRPDRFPFTLRLLDAATREAVWSVTVIGPGTIPVPPGWDVAAGRLLIAQTEWPDGLSEEQPVSREALS